MLVRTAADLDTRARKGTARHIDCIRPGEKASSDAGLAVAAGGGLGVRAARGMRGEFGARLRRNRGPGPRGRLVRAGRVSAGHAPDRGAGGYGSFGRGRARCRSRDRGESLAGAGERGAGSRGRGACRITAPGRGRRAGPEFTRIAGGFGIRFRSCAGRRAAPRRDRRTAPVGRARHDDSRMAEPAGARDRRWARAPGAARIGAAAHSAWPACTGVGRAGDARG